MARLIPEYGARFEALVSSAAERRAYESLKKHLSDDFLVFHSVTWLGRARDNTAQDGECDFLIVHPEMGLLMMEVKGGGVSYDAYTGAWQSRDRNGVNNAIKNPFDQARNAKHQILALLRGQREWSRIVGGKICIAHAVWFADLQTSVPIEGPDRPAALILLHSDLENPEPALRRAFDYCGEDAPARLGKSGAAIVERVFARRFSVLPTAVARIADEERRRIDLTNAQFKILKLLGSRRRVGIAGGAGTGKTLLAIEKAHELARAGFKTLLLAYNSALGEHLSATIDPRLPVTAAGFHSFCAQLFKKYGNSYLGRAKRDFPEAARWDVHYPAALCYLLEDHELKYDAIIVDEAQDFADEFWFPLECMMSDQASSPLYLFYDNNQRIYRRSASFPIKPDEEYALTENCRNTARIHAVVKRFFSGTELIAPQIEGGDVAWVTADTMETQARQICDHITRLVLNDKLPTEEIVVLIVDRLAYRTYYEALTRSPLPKLIQVSDDPSPRTGSLRVLTAAKFKGLECAVAFVWGVDAISSDSKRQELYVALSRPRNELYVIGTSLALEEIRNYTLCA